MKSIRLSIKTLALSGAIFGLSLLNSGDLQAQLSNYSEINIKQPGNESTVLKNVIMIRVKSEYNSQNMLNAFFASANLKLIEPIFPEYLSIKSKSNKTNTVLSATKYAEIVKAEEPLLRSYIVEFSGDEAPDVFALKLLKNRPEIEIVEPYYINMPLYNPNDPSFNQQATLLPIEAAKAWDIEKGSENVIVAISDDGMITTHPDLKDGIAYNTGEIPNDGIDNDNNGYIDDYAGYNMAWQDDGKGKDDVGNTDTHGTYVTGIAAARTDNSIGISGVSFNCKFLPIRAAKYYDTSIMYGYQSIIYAAVRGCKVINCSWGTVKPYSDIEQSVINYAVSKDLTVVAAGGNIKPNIDEYQNFYPAGYIGVLGVGETDAYDYVVTYNSNVARPVRIFAPGLGNMTVNLSDGYEIVGSGTSYSSPVVAGAMGVVRSKFPQLSAIQAQELIRVTGDDISAKNPGNRSLLPNRLNMYKAVTTDPASVPGIVLKKVEYYDSHGKLAQRFNQGDTISAKLYFKNYLGETKNNDFAYRIGYDVSSAVRIIDSLENVPLIGADEEFTLKNLRFIATSNFRGKIIFRVNLTNEKGFKDFYKFDYYNGVITTSFENSSLVFSVTDIGYVGYDETRKEGQGINFKKWGNQIYSGGLIAVLNDYQLFATTGSYDRLPFVSKKSFTAPEMQKGIVSAAYIKTPNSYSMDIEEKLEFPTNLPNTFRSKLTMTNVGMTTIVYPSVGYYFDWDVATDAQHNGVGLLNEAAPAKFQQKSNFAAEYAWATGNKPFVGAACFSDNTDFVSQAAGLTGDNSANVLKDALSKGTTSQTTLITDIQMVVGAKLTQNMNPGESTVCYVCVSAGETKDELISNLKKCADSTLVSVHELHSGNNSLLNNAVVKDNIIEVSGLAVVPGEIKMNVFDLTGNKIGFYVFNVNEGDFKININSYDLESGVYFIQSELAGAVAIKKINIIK